LNAAIERADAGFRPARRPTRPPRLSSRRTSRRGDPRQLWRSQQSGALLLVTAGQNKSNVGRITAHAITGDMSGGSGVVIADRREDDGLSAWAAVALEKASVERDLDFPNRASRKAVRRVAADRIRRTMIRCRITTCLFDDKIPCSAHRASSNSQGIYRRARASTRRQSISPVAAVVRLAASSSEEAAPGLKVTERGGTGWACDRGEAGDFSIPGSATKNHEHKGPFVSHASRFSGYCR